MSATFISHYRIVRRLGAGGMGEVYLAQDTHLERPVALKVMSAELAKDANHRQRFRTEAKAASGLSHPNICVIHEVGETEDGRPFLAMEYVEGQTLGAILQQRRLEIHEVLNLGIAVAEALEAAHARGFVHRDIKPANLMFDRAGRPKVMDFGLAKSFAPDELSVRNASAAHTQTGSLMGTPQYMSPEQSLGRPLDQRTDIFSLGVVLYETVAGHRPFPGETLGETINNIINQPLPPLGPENPVVSPALETVIAKCLEKTPEKRYASAKELADDLRKLNKDSQRAVFASAQEGQPATTKPASGEAQLTTPSKVPANAGGRRTLIAVLTIACAVLIGLGGWVLLRTGSKPTEAGANSPLVRQQKSVAVLPFLNLSADKADEYLSDGMTEELLNALAKVRGLRVPARTSCFVFKGKTDDIRKIGEQLSVATVLEGSVRKAGDKLRVTAQLINVTDGFHLWSDTYDRDMTNIFAVQSDIASRVAEALKVQLLGSAREPTPDIEAYKLLLQGRYLWNRRTAESIQQAIERFNQALVIDPNYAPAYAGLADCYQVLPAYTQTAPRAAEAKGRAAALKAIELAPQLAGPFAAMAAFKESYDWDWPGAEANYRKAIELDPNYPTARHWFAESLACQGRYEEAIREARQALRLDPLSPVVRCVLGKVLIAAGKNDEAVEVLSAQVAADASFAYAHDLLAGAYVAQGKLVEATSECETAARLHAKWRLEELGFCYARTGRSEDARKLLQQLLDLQKQGNDVSVALATIYHGLGEDLQALASLERAVDEHSFHLQFIMQYPFLKDLRPHPRFQGVLRKMNLLK